MATLVSAPMRAAVDGIVHQCGLGSAVLSGIVPDRRHLNNGGYHCSVEDLIAYGNRADYSNTRTDDRGFNPKYGAGFDVTMSKADMVRVYKRVHAVWKDKTDPRRKYVNAINVWDGTGDAVRLDFVTGQAKYASPDHKWHTHGEFRRRWVNDPRAGRAIVSMFKGESKATWSAREETGKSVPVKATPKPVATPAPKHAPGSRVLKYVPGAKILSGQDVTFVQKKIGARAGTPDGVFGAKTRAAVRWYQQSKGLQVDGQVGPATWRAMGVKTNL